MTSDNDNGEIVGNIDLINFLAGFGYWQITRESSGRMLVIVRTENHVYEKLYSRKGESLCHVVDRLRLKLIA